MITRFFWGTAIAIALQSLPLRYISAEAYREASALYSSIDELDEWTESSFPTGYDELGDKRIFHQKRIHTMKQQLNEHSSNLRDVRRRFQQIFYGRGDTLGAGGDPFAVEKEFRQPPPLPGRNPIVYLPPEPRVPQPESYPVVSPELQNELDLADQENELAFQVESPGQFSGMPENEIPVTRNSSLFSYYVFPRIGYSHPSKKHYSAGEYLKEYKDGYTLSISSGLRRDPWSFGFDFSHRKNDLKRRSYFIGNRSGKHWGVESGSNSSSTILLQGSYAIRLYSRLSLVLHGGLGSAHNKYTATLVNGGKSVPIHPKADWSLAGAGGGNLRWSFNEYVAAHAGLHYYYEEEVPSYNADLGLEFEF